MSAGEYTHRGNLLHVFLTFSAVPDEARIVDVVICRRRPMAFLMKAIVMSYKHIHVSKCMIYEPDDIDCDILDIRLTDFPGRPLFAYKRCTRDPFPTQIRPHLCCRRDWHRSFRIPAHPPSLATASILDFCVGPATDRVIREENPVCDALLRMETSPARYHRKTTGEKSL